MRDKIRLVDLSKPSRERGAEQDNQAHARVPEAAFAQDQIGPGREVCMHFALHLSNGEIIDSNFGQTPVTFRIGDGNLLPGFERALFGLRAGAGETLLLPPQEAFGEVNEDNIQGYPLYQFPADLPLEKGLMVAFRDASGHELTGVISEVDKTRVMVDFNHPLAGRSIEFKVQILSVEPTVEPSKP